VSGLSQAKQNYERELLLHATDIENLAQVKREVSNQVNWYMTFSQLLF